MTSAAVMSTTSPPMYSGKPFSLVREATTLSWVLFRIQNFIITQQPFQPAKPAPLPAHS
jgi:hypothetical protein